MLVVSARASNEVQIAIPVMHGSMRPATKIPGFMQEVDRRGVVDTSKVAVGGHSYGAFMAANLLVSSGAQIPTDHNLSSASRSLSPTTHGVKRAARSSTLSRRGP